MPIVTPEQKRHFEEQGYVLLSGLIPPEVSEAAAAALWRSIGATPDDPATWVNQPHFSGQKDPAILACYTPQLCMAVAELADKETAFPPPGGAGALNVFPQEGPWRPQGPHIDHALPKDSHHVFPPPMNMASLLYLSDVQSHGAATLVWPGSHKKIEALAQSDPAHYALMATLNGDLSKLDLGDPIEILGKRGDILCYHYLCAHSGSPNVTDHPRFALAHKW